MADPATRSVNGPHWRVLAVVCTMMWGIYFMNHVVYDLPASLSIALSKHLSLSGPHYAYLLSTLYTVYAVPNCILPFFSGPAVQRYGERAVLLITVTSVIAGQLLFALAVQIRSPLGLILGRVLIGLGGEVIGVLASEIITRWFKDKQLSLALGLNLGVSRLGSVAGSAFIPMIIESSNVVSATWIGTLLSLGAIAISVASLLALTNAVSGQTTAPDTSSSAVPLRQLPRIYWHLSLICVLGYGGINTFTNSAQRFLASWFYHGDQRVAGLATSIPYALSGILVPVFGLLLDLPWFRSCPRALIASNFLLALAHLQFISRVMPILPLCLLGVAFALYGVAIWAAVAQSLVFAVQSWPSLLQNSNSSDSPVQEFAREGGYESIRSSTDSEDAQGESSDLADSIHESHEKAIMTLGFGIMTSLLNASTAVVPILLAETEEMAGFDGLERVFLALAVLGYFASVRLAWIWKI